MFFRSFKRRDRAESESGLALVEFAISMPFLTVLMLSSLDVGQLLIQYIQMSAAVREGARVASATTDIDGTAVYAQLTSGQHCESGHRGGPDEERHQRIQQRVMQVMGQRTLLIYSNKICVETTLTKDGAGEESVNVSLNTAYRGFFPIFDGMKLTVEAEAPYLS